MDTNTGCTILLNALKGFHGNIKIIYGQAALRLDDDTYLNTGSNKLFSAITEEDIEVCDINSGDLGVIFRKRTDVEAFVFGCSPDMVAASNAEEDMPVALEDLAQLVGYSVAVIDSINPDRILQGLKNNGLCFVKGIGAISVASSMKEAVAKINILEKSCEAFNYGKKLGGVVSLDRTVAQNIRDHYSSKYMYINDESHVDYVGFDEELFGVRSNLIDYGKNLVKESLVYGSGGNISLRLNDEDMLITPSSMDYFDIGIEDIVQLSIDALEHGKQRVPSSDAGLHAMMYKSLPGCNAIIHTHSNACSTFAACEAGFAMTDPKLQQIIGDVKVVPYIPDNKDEFNNKLLDTLNTTHAAILSHHGTIFYGPSLEVVFEIAKSVELMARNLLNFNAPAEEEVDNEEK